ncbi:uncharacterized protein C8Q71DRAFT_777672 [Rhodofomes roseus]|uniref:Uncharacterized protein n=1 Tax=Rhodofomes roseus TaxID=34475 RepID=A0ABQ8K5G6_9APHY|nr:uncharacterized protein C8Q71DRAFT_777672 [Rhodofomes roseus]KAH9832160.1 hypothetical protein C8Q71DRAFT_777672 [Rhodofomes roseus]
MQSYRAVNGSSMLYQNSIKSLVVHGLIKKNDGKENPLVVSRTTYADLTTHFTETGGKPNTHYSHEIPSTGPVPDLPPDGDIKLHLELGEMLHQGDDNHTTVYRVEPSSSHPSATASTYYPPMVIKVAPEREGRRLAEESALYARFRCLQGSVIPRCYGYFRERVDLLHNVVMPWSPDCEFPRDDLDIFQLPNSNASLNFLLLEYLDIPWLSHLGETSLTWWTSSLITGCNITICMIATSGGWTSKRDVFPAFPRLDMVVSSTSVSLISIVPALPISSISSYATTKRRK